MTERPIAENDVIVILDLLERLPEDDVHSRIKRAFENGRRETLKIGRQLRWIKLASAKDADALFADILDFLKHGQPTTAQRTALNRVGVHLQAMK